MGQGFQGFTIPAPNGGLNLVDPIDNMDPSDALDLVNVVPSGVKTELRKGYTQYASIGSVITVNALFNLPLADGTNQLVATTNSKIYKVTSSTFTDVTGATVPTSGAWQGQTFKHRLYLCNGVDNAQVYDGSTTADITFTGPTLSNLVNVSAYRERLYFVEKNTCKFWYGNAQAIGASALTAYDLEYYFQRGGYLLFAGSFTNQTASSSQDLFWAISSEGEILFYQGSYPGDATTPWQTVSRFVIPRPLGYNAFVRVNGDVWVITEQGIIPISVLFQSDPGATLETVGRKINPLITQYAATIGASNLWRGCFYPVGRKVFIQIPTSGSTAIFAVYHQISKSWTTYQLYGAGDCLSMAVSGGTLYFGSSDGKVHTGETGYNDNGQAVAFQGKLAFNFFGSRGIYKAFKDLRPLMYTKRGLTLSMGLDTNFQNRTNLDTITTTTGIYTPWGSPWGSAWSSGNDYIYDRSAVINQGHCAAIRFQGSIKDAPLELYGFEIRFDAGGQV